MPIPYELTKEQFDKMVVKYALPLKVDFSKQTLSFTTKDGCHRERKMTEFEINIFESCRKCP